MRKILLLLSILATGLVLGYPFFSSPASESEAPPSLQPYQWANALHVPPVPAEAFADSLWADPIERAVRRLEWGTPEVVYWTQSHLPSPVDPFRRRLEEHLLSVARSSPVARYHLETLGLIGDARSVPLLLRYATSDPDYLQLSALTALTHCPLDSAAETALAELSQHSSPQVAAAARRAIVERQEFWDLDTLRSFLESLRGGEANTLLDRVGEANILALADSVALHLDEEVANTRRVAIRALLRLGDERGMRAAELEIARPDPSSVELGLTLYRDVGLLPPLERAKELVGHPDPDVRLALAQSLARGERSSEGLRDSVIPLLQSIADTEDPVLRSSAIRSLHSWGHEEHLEEFRRRVREDHGESLKEAARFLCEVIRDPATATLVRDRLRQTDLDPIDVANLLFGLRFVGDAAEDGDCFLDRMLVAGTRDDRRSASSTYLSEFAALYLQTLGGGCVPALVEAFSRAPNSRARFLVLDALRGTADDADDSAALIDAIVGWVGDKSLELDVRLAALDTLMYVGRPEVGPKLRSIADSIDSKPIADRSRRLVLCYF